MEFLFGLAYTPISGHLRRHINLQDEGNNLYNSRTRLDKAGPDTSLFYYCFCLMSKRPPIVPGLTHTHIRIRIMRTHTRKRTYIFWGIETLLITNKLRYFIYE